MAACGDDPANEPAGAVDPDAGAETSLPEATSDADSSTPCGNGVLDPGEVCDDGNVRAGDICNSDCTVASCLVPVTHPTLSAGIADRACPTVYVLSGTYKERLTLSRDVVVRGLDKATVILDGEAAGTVVTVDAGRTVTLADVTLKNGRAERGGGISNAGSLTLAEMSVSENVAAGAEARGGGIYNFGGTIVARRVVIARNRSQAVDPANAPPGSVVRGAGIYSEGGSLTFEGSSAIEENIASIKADGASAFGGGISARDTVVRLTDSSNVRANEVQVDSRPGTVLGYGGGIELVSGSLTVTAANVLANRVNGLGENTGLGMGSIEGGGIKIAEGTIALENASIRDNEATITSDGRASARGGGLSIERSTAFVTNATIVANTSRAMDFGRPGYHTGAAGGVFLDRSEASFMKTTISNNTADGAWSGEAGGLRVELGASQKVSLGFSGVSANRAQSSTGWVFAGGVQVLARDLEPTGIFSLAASTVSGNKAIGKTSGRGGGLILAGSPANLNAVIESSTLSGNRVEATEGAAVGGGILATGVMNLVVGSSTIAQNTALGASAIGGGFDVYRSSEDGPSYVFRNTIVAENVAASSPDCATGDAVITSAAYNLIGDVAGCTIAGNTTGNRTGAAGLLPLALNGATTATHALAAGSQAKDNGNPAGCVNHAGTVLAVDQRGVARNGRCDIGAFEAP